LLQVQSKFTKRIFQAGGSHATGVPRFAWLGYGKAVLAIIDEILTTTRAVRYRLDMERPVDLQQVKECLGIALQAPNGGNTQRWQWLVVADAQQRAAVAEVYRRTFQEKYGHILASAGDSVPGVLRGAQYLAENLHRVPVMIIPCVQLADSELPPGNQAGLWGSVLPAAWSYMLAARSRGLGTTWTAVHLAREKEVADVLGLPATVRQGALIPTAHVTGRRGFRPAARKPVEDVMHLDRWQDLINTSQRERSGFDSADRGSSPEQADLDRHEAAPWIAAETSVPTVLEEGSRRTARLLVDQAHPFYFDHFLDHVPASLLVGGLLELVEPRALLHTAEQGGRLRFRLRVPTMAELDPPCVLSVTRGTDAARHWQLRVSQQDVLIADGELELGSATPDAAPVCTVPERPDAADQRLVHRRRRENVMVGRPWEQDGWLLAPLCYPAADHHLTRREPLVGAVETLLEAGRQFGTLYGHLVQRRSLDSQILLLGVTVDLPVTLPSCPEVTLRAKKGPFKGNRGHLVVEYLDGGSAGDRIGELDVAYVVVSASAYRRMRDAKAAS
jgi:nitroreductase